jgi:zinc/manganese transport system substrate-binding protein
VNFSFLRWWWLLGLFAFTAAAKPLVVSSNTILADFVRVVGSDDVESACLLTRGGDPHTFEPKPSDMRTLGRADLLVANGLGFEPWLQKLAAPSGFHGTIVEASRGISPLRRNGDTAAKSFGFGGDQHDEAVDPHAWHDLRNARRYVENIRDALIRLVPAQADAFRTRAAAYLHKLDELQTYVVAQLAALPPDRRKLVTSHDALRYFGAAYGLTIVPVSGLQPDREPSAKQLAALVHFIRDQNVPAVFIEATSNPKLLNLIARDAGVTVVHELYTDSLGPVGSAGETFTGMIRANVDIIASSLK